MITPEKTKQKKWIPVSSTRMTT
ncbi:MAG: hypothetical protein KAH33_05785 [Candidatus Delongbacteria bacterium]|nr:hypothetical protein [Candidatus Delongbacteria bacterium]